MHQTFNTRTLVLAAIAGFAITAAAAAQATTITLPPETATFEQSTLPGYQKVLQNCTACHAAQYMQTQPASSLKWWQGEVRKMKATYGANIPDADMDVMADYLFSVYGSGHGSDKANAVQASVSAAGSTAAAGAAGASANAAAPTQASSSDAAAIDAEALIKANNCLACHAIDHKVVGPAYQDVAKKYAGKADAVTELADHIQHGGSGRWGPVPMPPFANLSDAQAKALAGWVLKGG